MDPSAERISNFGIHGAPIYDWLVWQGANGDLVPGVAEKWEMSTDGKTWTFTLRSGMRFHDGTAVTAEDVKFSLERLPRPGANSTNVGLWRGVDPKVDVVSPTTARVNLKTPLPLANYFVAPIEGPEGAVLPKTYFERVGADGF
ncbi:MAG: hypothetical protein HYX97_01985, partial [Chloroflexi bacterium]|nr:hypothetical protein [Chloroflexota bacterium]